MKRIAGLSDIIADFDAVVTDQYGVLHNGERPYRGARTALEELAKRGIPVVTLTNSGKRSATNAQRLARLGFPKDLVGHVVSSGELARQRLAQLAPGTPVTLVTRDGETELIDGLDLRVVSAGGTQQPSMVVLAGVRPEEHTRSDYAQMLGCYAEHHTQMLLVNPDTLMAHGEMVFFGAGAVAEDYAAQGGQVLPLGKPAPAMFEAALDFLAPIPPNRVLMIGDSPEHDISGARAAGLKTLLIKGGVQSGLEGGRADYVADLLDWS